MFTINKKYLKPSTVEEALEYKDEIVDLLNGYSYEGFLDTSVKKRLLELYTYAVALFPNKKTTLFRGMLFRQVDFSKYAKLALKLLTTKQFVTKELRSWSASREIADEFSYHNLDGSSTVIDNVNGSMTISVSIPSGTGIDLDLAIGGSSDFLENEVLLPPGSYDIKVENAAFFMPYVDSKGNYYSANDNYNSYTDLGISYCLLNGPKTSDTFARFYQYTKQVSYSEFVKKLTETANDSKIKKAFRQDLMYSSFIKDRDEYTALVKSFNIDHPEYYI